MTKAGYYPGPSEASGLLIHEHDSWKSVYITDTAARLLERQRDSYMKEIAPRKEVHGGETARASASRVLHRYSLTVDLLRDVVSVEDSFFFFFYNQVTPHTARGPRQGELTVKV